MNRETICLQAETLLGLTATHGNFSSGTWQCRVIVGRVYGMFVVDLGFCMAATPVSPFSVSVSTTQTPMMYCEVLKTL